MSTQTERAGYRPGIADPARIEAGKDGRYVLVLPRELRESPERVWRLLTHPEELKEWAPFDATHDLGVAGTTTLSMAGADRRTEMPAHVRQAESPRRLEYTWGQDVLCWELEPTRQGTRLTLRHTTADRKSVPKVAAGWQICLDVAERFLEGRPVGRIVAGEAKKFDWERLNAEYSARLGLETRDRAGAAV